MSAHTKETFASDNDFIVGAVAHSSTAQNETIQALIQFKTMSNELRKEVNKNSVDYGIEQGDAENSFYHDQSIGDMRSAALGFTGASIELGGTIVGGAISGNKSIGEKDPVTGKDMSLNNGISRESATIDDCSREDKEIGKLRNQSEPSVQNKNLPGASGKPVADKDGPASADEELTRRQTANDKKRAVAKDALRSFEDRKSTNMRQFQSFTDAASKLFQAADKLNSSVQGARQGEDKLAEIAAQTASSMNQNVWKNFDTINDTMASEVTSTIQTYGQGMVQANTHYKG